MEQISKVESGHNYLIVSLSGDQSFVKIFDASGELIRYSQTKGATEIQQMAPPGEYRVETDGTTNQLRSVHIDLEAKAKDILNPTQIPR